ncbi:MAG: DNA-3-methyladenine glycosylase [Candidatus Pacebacteria bacterium]|nr:DNA-3-methyladenine glycosylase [Candidatus Paceibacterota bacterium]
MRKVIGKEFLNRSAVTVAQELLGKFLVIKNEAFMITEVEAYDGLKDLASHASRGRTLRNVPMFESAGTWYVYFVYGNYFMLNIVTGEEGYPAAVLIRGVEGIKGPGRLTKKLGIDKKFNNLKASKKTGLWIEDRGVRVKKSQIKKLPRVGVEYAGPIWNKKLWRFYLS